MDFFIKPLLEIKAYTKALESIKKYNSIVITGPFESQKMHLAYSICRYLNKKGVFISYNEHQARKMYEDSVFFFNNDALFLSSKEIFFHDIEARSRDIYYERINNLYRLNKGDFKFLTTSAKTLLDKLPDEKNFLSNVYSFSVGMIIEPIKMQKIFMDLGYEKVEIVEAKGQYASRGGIVDVYTISEEHPIRIDFLDNEIESIRIFDELSQRSIKSIRKFFVLPSKEVLIEENDIYEITDNIKKELKKFCQKRINDHDEKFLDQLKIKINSDIEKIQNNTHFYGNEKYVTYIIKKPQSIIDYLGKDTIIFIDEPGKVKIGINDYYNQYVENCATQLEKGNMLPSNTNVLFKPDIITEKINKKATINLNAFVSKTKETEKMPMFKIKSKQNEYYGGSIGIIIDQLKQGKKKNARQIILAGSPEKSKKFSEYLNKEGFEVPYVRKSISEIKPRQTVIMEGFINEGFEYSDVKFNVFNGAIFFKRKRKSITKTARNKNRIKSFSDITAGDYVVHQTHGIGKYIGINQLVVENIKKDYLKIKYKNDDYLYIPVQQLDYLQKYIGSEGKRPKLNKLGSAEWIKTKKRVKESLKNIAQGLIKLYSQRQSLKGFAFSKDTLWQKEFEEAFMYEETRDQINSINEVKKDMESERPMDRLLCGDVGYGKTEVALRAAFKAINNSKQVAYLVPTTVLAQQQYETFKKRMDKFPVNVEVISRFKKHSEQKRILKKIKSGSVDILIGTHRIIQNDIEFKDLGLLLIDEEQRFGVEHKEKLKNIKPEVDVLMLTATPIPRTLQMSLSGIRDISIIEDPPENRFPVQTYVLEHDDDMIKEAIEFELNRQGQVFYLCNRVKLIDKKVYELKRMLPKAKIVSIHGQMNENDIEREMLRFINNEYDVLVCTTIIESGLDMPNVNTIIVEDADRLGLSQLYQLRGRVGRSDKQAYAYLSYKKDKIITEIAEKRLKTIMEFTEFGSGFKIAMRDLEIRGAGNFLGRQQHGHMNLVGYEMYCKLLDETVREFKGEKIKKEIEVSIDINISAYIDNKYIDNESQRVEMYKKIALIDDEQSVFEIKDEAFDRFGKMPIEMENLINIAYIKSLAGEIGFTSVQERYENIIFQYSENVVPDIEVINRLSEKYGNEILFTACKNPYITYKAKNTKKDNLLKNIKILLQNTKKLMLDV